MNLTKSSIKNQYIQILGHLMNNLSFYYFGQKLYNKLLDSFPQLAKYLNGGRGDENLFKSGKNKKQKGAK